MANSTDLNQRLAKLGLHCDQVPHDRISSAVAALACFPMYMVANVHAWSDDKQWHLSIVDLPGIEQIREAFAMGRQEKPLHLERAHRRVLGMLVSHARPCDLVVYEYALETLELVLARSAPELATILRASIARMIVAVAEASGEGWLGSGPKVSAAEATCIRQIARQLGLAESPAAADVLREYLA